MEQEETKETINRRKVVIMKLEYVIQGLKDSGISIQRPVKQNFMTTLVVSNYIKIIAYHNKEKEVDQLNVFAVVGVNMNTHYKDVINVIDKCTNLLSDLTTELRVSLYDKIKLGEPNDINLDLDHVNIKYKLTENGLLDYSILDNRL